MLSLHSIQARHFYHYYSSTLQTVSSTPMVATFELSIVQEEAVVDGENSYEPESRHRRPPQCRQIHSLQLRRKSVFLLFNFRPPLVCSNLDLHYYILGHLYAVGQRELVQIPSKAFKFLLLTSARHLFVQSWTFNILGHLYAARTNSNSLKSIQVLAK